MANGNNAASVAIDRKRSVPDQLRLLLHTVAAAHFWYGIYYDCAYVHFGSKHPNATHFGGKFKYLTFLDMIVQAVYFTICIVNDLCGSNDVMGVTKLPLIRILKDFWLSAFAFPLAFNVGISFWALWHIDRELVLPRALDAVLPGWLNHVMHTNIMLFITVELLTTFRQYPARRVCLTALTLFMVSYLVWIHIVRHYSGIWVYPVLEVLNLPQRIVFFAVCIAIGALQYIAGELLNNWFWKPELRRLGRGGKSKVK